MAWDFETDAEFQRELDWTDRFVREEVEPLDMLLGEAYDVRDESTRKHIRPLKQRLKERGLWACHLGADLGGQGYGQLKLALLNELLGRSRFAPLVFGCQAPDSGNAEILAHYGTPAQKAKYLQPLLNGEIVSCYSMTEPHAGADPTLFTTRAVRSGNEWVINGEKWFSSNARWSSFLIVMAVTDPEVDAHGGMSMFIVPTDTPGVTIVRNVGVGMERPEHASHAYIKYENVRVPADHLLGKPGGAFVIAQNSLGISAMSVTRLVQAGVLPAAQPVPGLPAVISREDLQLDDVKKAVQELKQSHNRPLTQDPKQLSLFPTTNS